MNKPPSFQELISASRAEASPRLDVADRVVASISATPVIASDRPLQWMAGLSVAAALMVLPSLLAESFYDPMGYWLSSLTVVMQ